MASPASAGTKTVENSPLGTRRSVGMRYRLALDRFASLIIGLGGAVIIAVILAILLVLFVEVAPLFQSPTARLLNGVTAGAVTPAARIGVDEYRQITYTVDASGITAISLRDGTTLAQTPTALPAANSQDGIAAISNLEHNKWAIATRTGKLVFGEAKFETSASSQPIDSQFNAALTEPLDFAPLRTVRSLVYRETKDGKIVAGQTDIHEVVIARITEQKSVIGTSTFSDQNWTVALPITGEISSVAPDNRGEDIFVGTSDGQLVRIDLRDGDPKYAGTTTATGGAAITALCLLLGDRTLIAADAEGGISSWQLLADENGDARLQRIHAFAPHSAAVISVSPSDRDKGFLTGDKNGIIKLHYATTGSTRLSLSLPQGKLQAVAYAPHADGFMTLSPGGAINNYDLENKHPEITVASLFGRVWYEGDPKPTHTWQSTGGADDFESKLGLVPLIYGTLKGSFYTLLFSVPIAILAALYTSQFMLPRWKNLIKPAVEIMAGLPSVVLGFIAALWLAPNIDTVLPGVLAMPLVLLALVAVSVTLWRALPAGYRSRLKPGRELIVLIPVIALGAWLSLKASDFLVARLLGGDYHAWLRDRLGLTYDQRNSLVVSLAMGFAVIPIIFTIAEDSLSNVPRHLVLAARALGANKWETALRVVLPTASPGIFSAIMIGLGRAVGETMIVLMATGNTPIMSWNIFNGFRALSANIAVELPEAPAGGTLFRVLFLTALLLFALTFVVNTAAELVRLRLRRRYSSL